MSAATRCVSDGFCIEGPDTDVVGTDGCGRGGSGAAGSIAGSGMGVVVVMVMVNGRV